MPSKGTSSKKTNASSRKKLPGFLQNKRMVLLLLVIVSASVVGGTIMLRRSSALGQPCGAGSGGCSPTIEQCVDLAVPSNITLYAKANPTQRNSCVAAVQAYLAWRWGERLTVDGLFGYRTRDALIRFQRKTTFDSKPISATGSLGKSTWLKISLDCGRDGKGYDLICRTHYRYR